AALAVRANADEIGIARPQKRKIWVRQNLSVAQRRSKVIVGESSRHGSGQGKKARRRRGAMKELASCQKRGCHRVQKARQSRLPGPVICWLRLLDQVSRLAAASTIPVTNAAMQENSKSAFRTLARTASPYGSPPSAGHRRSWHHGQKVAELGQKCMPSGVPADSHAASGADRTGPRRAGQGPPGRHSRAAAVPMRFEVGHNGWRGGLKMFGDGWFMRRRKHLTGSL